MKFAEWLAVMPDWMSGLPTGLQRTIFQVFQTFVFEDRWYNFFLKGLGMTFQITLGALVLGVIIGVVIGSLILVGLYALFNNVVIPNLNTEIGDMFNYTPAP